MDKIKEFIAENRLALLLGLLLLVAHLLVTRRQPQNDGIHHDIQQWQILTSESKALKEDLIQCRQDLTRIKKPSAELLKELEEAEKRLKSLQEELTKQKEDLILLSSEVNELKTLSEKLKKQIDKGNAEFTKDKFGKTEYGAFSWCEESVCSKR